MKKIILSVTVLITLVIFGCSQIDYNHPLDSAASFKNPEFFQDSNNNGVADYWDPESEIYKSNLDTIAPELTLTGPNPALIPYGDPKHVLDELKKAYTVKDNRDENPTVEVRNIDFSVIFPDTNIIQYTARDASNNTVTKPRTVVVLPEAFRDTIDPQINISMINIEIFQNELFDQMKNVKAYDETDGDITSKITVTGTVNTAKPGVYTLTYKVKDSAGNEFVQERKITVVENTTSDDIFPVITLIGGDTIVIEEKAEWKDPLYKAEDNIDGIITDKVQTSGTVKATPGWYAITYTVSDKAMNITTKTRYVRRKGTVTTGDTTPPVVSLKYQKDTLVTVIKGAKFVVPELNILDNVDGQLSKDSIRIYPTINTGVVAAPISVTLLIYDKAQNEGRLVIKVQIVTGVVDNAPPVIKLKGKNPDTVNVSTTALYKDSGSTVTDNIDKNLTATVKGTVDRKTAGTYTLTYTAYDAAGNADSVKRVVVVKAVSSSDLLEKYQVVAAPALPTLNKSYTSAEIDGDATSAPNLAAMKEYKINWNKEQKQIYDMSMNLTTVNYVPLKVTHTLDKASPTMTFTGVTQIPKLDGEYYVVIDGTNLVLVNKDGTFAIIMKP